MFYAYSYYVTGNSKNAPVRDYSITGSQTDHIFGASNGISIIATTYASGIIPEIQVLPSIPSSGGLKIWSEDLCTFVVFLVSHASNWLQYNKSTNAIQ